MARSRIVILTRPGDADRDLMRRLDADGVRVWHWPAFAIRPTEHPERIASTIQGLGPGDMVVFVSPNVVAMTHAVLPVWPKEVAIGCAGIATAQVVRLQWGQSMHPVYPGKDVAQSGSEALFALLKEQGFPKRVVIARAQSGRAWFSEKMQEAGVQVRALCVYRREPLVLDGNACAALKEALTEEPPILYVTSSEAFTCILEAVAAVPGAKEWLLAADVLTIHERCVARARELGFSHVELVDTSFEALHPAIVQRMTSD